MQRRIVVLLTILLCIVPAVWPSASAASLPGSAPLSKLWLPNGPVNAAAVAGDTLYIGGQFSAIGPPSGSFVALDPTSAAYDPAFPRVAGKVSAIIADGSGGWFIGGAFSAVDGQPRANLAHIKADKTLDLAWAPAVGTSPTFFAGAEVTALALAGGRLYVGGSFDLVDGQPRTYLAALASSGTGALDTDWRPAPTNLLQSGAVVINALLVDGGRLYVGGTFTQIGGAARRNLAALALAGSGTADAVWAPEPDAAVTTLLKSGSALYVGGFFTTIGGLSQPYLASIAPTGSGSAAGDWRPALNSGVRALAVSGTELYIGGFFSMVGGQSRSGAAAVGLANALPTAWNPSISGFPVAAVTSVAVRADRIYIGGTFDMVGGVRRVGLAQVGLDGSLEGWDAALGGGVNAIAVTDAAVYIAGSMTTVNNVPRSNLAAIDLRTGRAIDWRPAANFSVDALAVSGARVFIGGQFTTIDGVARARLAAIETGGAGALDTAWSADVTGPTASAAVIVYTLLVDGDRLYVGGSFGSIDGVRRNALAAVGTNGDGAVDLGWNPLVDGLAVRALVLADERLYVGGAFAAAGGQPRHNLAALSPSGVATAVDGWQPDPNSQVVALARGADRLYVGGEFMTIAGQARPRLAALTPGGALDSSWQGQIADGAYPNVRSLALDGDTLYVTGGFATANDAPRSNLAAFDAGTGGLLDWAPALSGGVPTGYALAVADNVMYVGGSFDSAGPRPSRFLAGFATADVVTGAASAIERHAAQVAGEVAAHNTTATVAVEWGEAPGSYTWRIAAAPSPLGTRAPVTIGAALSGLRPATTYYYRLVLTGGSGTTVGAERQFTTLPGQEIYLPLVTRAP